MKIVGLILAAILVTATSAAVTFQRATQPPPSRFDDTELVNSVLVDKLLPSSVTILKRKPGILNDLRDTDVVGAGVVLRATRGRPMQILTVAHVSSELGTGGYIRVTLRGQRILMRVNVTNTDERHDLAILSTEASWDFEDISAQLADEPPKRGEQIWVIGAPDAIEWSVSMGVVSSKHPCANREGTCYSTDASLTYGNSGGAAYNNMGRVIGIADYVRIEERITKEGSVEKIIVPGSATLLSWNTIGKYLEDLTIIPRTQPQQVNR
jgi:S1-C subfamily serine protease